MNIVNKKLLVLTSSVLFAVSANANIMESSDKYLSDYITYIDSISTEKAKVEALKKELRRAKSAVNKNKSDQKSVNVQVGREWQLKKSLPNQIQWSKNKISQNQNEIRNIMQNYFPGVNDVSAAEASIANEERRLRGRIEGLNRQIREKEGFYLPQIREIESGLGNKQSRISRLEGEIQTLKSENQRIKESKKEKRREVKELEALAANPAALDAKLKAARQKYKKAEERRIAKGKSCNGLSPIFSETCRKWNRAKKNLAYWKSVKSGKKLRKLKQELRLVKGQIEENRQEIQAKRDRLQRVKRRLARDRQELDRLVSDLNFEVNGIKSEQSRLNRRLQGVSSKRTRITRVVTLQKEVAGHSRSLKKYESDLRNIDARISNLKNDLKKLEAALPSLERAKQQRQNEYDLKALSVDQKKKRVDQNALVLKDALLDEKLELSEAVELPISAEKVLLESKKWDVTLSETSDLVAERGSCFARTEEVSNTGGVALQLSIVKIKSPSGEYSEPVVLVTASLKEPVFLDEEEAIDSDDEVVDAPVEEAVVETLDAFVNLKSSVGGKKFDFNLIPSISNTKKRVFISNLSDREEIISMIRRKNSFPVTFSKEDSSEEASFSLKGSSNAVKKSSSSLSNSCGGLSIY